MGHSQGELTRVRAHEDEKSNAREKHFSQGVGKADPIPPFNMESATRLGIQKLPKPQAVDMPKAGPITILAKSKAKPKNEPRTSPKARKVKKSKTTVELGQAQELGRLAWRPKVMKKIKDAAAQLSPPDAAALPARWSSESPLITHASDLSVDGGVYMSLAKTKLRTNHKTSPLDQ